MGWWNQILTRRAEDWTYGALSADQVPDRLAPTTLEADEHYLEIFLQSMRVRDVRKGVAKFYGTVHSSISVVPGRLGDAAEFHVVAVPKTLRDLDAKNVDRVLVLNHRLLGPVPYRGGDVDIELGLFSVKAADLADPFLNVLEELASRAGVAFVEVAKPFVEPLKHGIELLTGSSDASILEIGLAKTFNPAEVGHFVVVRAPKETISLSDLRLDHDGKLLLHDAPLQKYPYVVISITAASVRADWRSIPEVGREYEVLGDAVIRQNVSDVHDALSSFKVTVLWSPDLLKRDADRIVKRVEGETKKAMQAIQTSGGERYRLPELAELEL